MFKENRNIRLRNYDYSKAGIYFITICTQKRENFLGEIKNDEVVFSEIGYIANEFWNDIPNHFKNVRLHGYIIMPNHIHGVIEIINKEEVDSRHVVNLQKFGPLKPGSISVIIGQFKASVSRWCNKNGINHFGWQRRYYDRIIRDNRELKKVAEYIRLNPKKWDGDRFYN